MDEEETTSIRELVQAIDADVDPKVSSTLHAADDDQFQQLRTEDIPSQPAGEATRPPPVDPFI